MTRGAPRFALLLFGLAASCAPALRKSVPLPSIPSTTRNTEDLLAEAGRDFAKRGLPGRAEAAERLYLQAAAADERGVAGLVGAMVAISYRIERGAPDALRLANQATELGQSCLARAPENGACDYRLAIALGEVARADPRRAFDALKRMVALLNRAIAADPAQDHAGPHRVLALVLLRAPGWPAGPGDAEEGLKEAQQAVSLFPDVPENQLALAEALKQNRRPREAQKAFEQALRLAQALDRETVPEARGWEDEAKKALTRGGGSR